MQLSQHLEKIATFGQVCALGSFKAASVRLRLSQPALSRAVRILEETVGHALLVRTPKGVLATPAGNVMLNLARSIDESTTAAAAQIAALSGPTNGSLRVGMYESIAIYFWPDFLRSFQATNPGLSLFLRTDRSDALLRLVLDSEVDACLSIDPETTKLLTSVPLFYDHFGIYMAEGVAPTSASSLILFESALRRVMKEVKTSLGALGCDVAHFVKTDSFEVVKALTLAGAGIGILPTRIAEPEIRIGKLKEWPASDLWQRSKHAICLTYLSKNGNSMIAALEGELRRGVLRR